MDLPDEVRSGGGKESGFGKVLATEETDANRTVSPHRPSSAGDAAVDPHRDDSPRRLVDDEAPLRIDRSSLTAAQFSSVSLQPSLASATGRMKARRSSDFISVLPPRDRA